MRAEVRASILCLLGLSFGLACDGSPTSTPEEAEPVLAQSAPPGEARPAAGEPGVAVHPLRTAYFGELHLHTSYSLDAYIFGNTMNDPFVAYRFAQGEEVELPTGGTKRIRSPLDFAAVTDHAEVLGEYEICTDPKRPDYASETCGGIRSGDLRPFHAIFAGLAKTPARRLVDLCGEDGLACEQAIPVPWSRIQQAAADSYVPGRFTTFVAFEFSANAPEGSGGMMHRNVIFRGASVPDTVFSAFDGTAEQLHAWLDETCTGDCRVLTIPHNPNFYWGRLYWGRNTDGSAWTPEIVERRARLDRLVEVMQIKGNSECQLGIGTTDDDCGFETVFPECKPGQRGGCSDFDAFVRNGLKLGLRHEAELGVNPFKQGLIGSTDNHNGTPGDTAEDDFRGHAGRNDADARVRLGLEPNALTAAMGLSAADDPTRFYNPGALAGVWAESNTREAIWDALHRKETFGTSGTRTRIRMFGGFDLPPTLDQQPDWVAVADARGVPQGGDLKAASPGTAPTFVVWAQADPASAPLARLQIVKGWLEDGEPKEATLDVACSDGAVPDPAIHRCPANGATVDLGDCSPSEGVGDSELSATWIDADFDPAQRAFYYARVIENPVCRWSTHDALALGVELPADLPATVQERAWSSPIWYTP